ncbi:MAG: hypothetical protein C4292_05555 [Nitrososphaera sp.]
MCKERGVRQSIDLKNNYLLAAIAAGIIVVVVVVLAVIASISVYNPPPLLKTDATTASYSFPSGVSYSCGAGFATGSYIEARGFKEIVQVYKPTMAGAQGVYQFVLAQGSAGKITQVIDYNPGDSIIGEITTSKTTQNVMQELFHQNLSEHFNQVDIYKIDTCIKDPSQQSISLIYLPRNQTTSRISIVASNISNVTNSKVQVTYNVGTMPSTEKGVYLLGLTYTCPGAILTVGDKPYTGPLPWDNGTRY